MYEIEFTPVAREDLRYFKKYERNIIVDAIETRLTYDPTIENHNRFRREPPEIADYELRLGDFRVFYNVDEFVQLYALSGLVRNQTIVSISAGRKQVEHDLDISCFS